MLAKLYKSENGYTALFERYFDVPFEKLWASLVNNENFKFWMEHLEITDLSKGGTMLFHYHDGSGKYEKMAITDFADEKVLQFEWGADTVRFETVPNGEGSLLILKEFIRGITDHTPKDLAGWHVCLLRFNDVVTGESNELAADEWEKWYSEYGLLVKNYNKE